MSVAPQVSLFIAHRTSSPRPDADDDGDDDGRGDSIDPYVSLKFSKGVDGKAPYSEGKIKSKCIPSVRGVVDRAGGSNPIQSDPIQQPA